LIQNATLRLGRSLVGLLAYRLDRLVWFSALLPVLPQAALPPIKGRVFSACYQIRDRDAAF
jgi:hypothetical protein